MNIDSPSESDYLYIANRESIHHHCLIKDQSYKMFGYEKINIPGICPGNYRMS
jgi:hypothetical protein